MFKSIKSKVILISALMIAALKMPTYAATYTVLPGDSLYKIGTLFSITSSSISSSNGLTGTTIYPGQKLNINCTTYSVKSGDSLYLIAQKFGVSLASLRMANNKWDNSIYPSQVLLIPKAQSSSGSTYKAPAISYTQSDIDLLARLITAEADGQPYTAKVAVGAVIVNRVKSPDFPNTISGVIYEVSDGYYQFTPVLNGWINKPALGNARQAALDALNGVDPTNGALYYFDDSATNAWLWSKPIALRVSNMVFTYK